MKYSLIAAKIACLVTPTFADLLIYEPFDYESTAEINANGFSATAIKTVVSESESGARFPKELLELPLRLPPMKVMLPTKELRFPTPKAMSSQLRGMHTNAAPEWAKSLAFLQSIPHLQPD